MSWSACSVGTRCGQATRITEAWFLIKNPRMRFLIACLGLLAACTPIEKDRTHPIDDPDANWTDCAAGFAWLAPKSGLTYSPDVTVTIQLGEWYADRYPGVVAIDEANKGFEPTAPPTRTPAGNSSVEMRWPFSLEHGHRYTLYFSATECDNTLDFFTN